MHAVVGNRGDPVDVECPGLVADEDGFANPGLAPIGQLVKFDLFGKRLVHLADRDVTDAPEVAECDDVALVRIALLVMKGEWLVEGVLEMGGHDDVGGRDERGGALVGPRNAGEIEGFGPVFTPLGFSVRPVVVENYALFRFEWQAGGAEFQGVAAGLDGWWTARGAGAQKADKRE